VSSVRQIASWGGDLYVCGVKSGASKVYKASEGTYPTTAVTLETPLFGANLQGDAKGFRSATVNHAALASGQSVELQYRLEDAGSWTSLGSSSTVGDTSKTFTFSNGVSGKLAALRVLLTATSSATPVVYSVLVRYVPLPPTKRRWTFEALFEGTAELPLITIDGAPSSQTGATIAASTWAVKTGSQPVTFTDLDGSSYATWFLDLEEVEAQRSQRRGYSTRGKVTLLEA
jgi:hypothetical protein